MPHATYVVISMALSRLQFLACALVSPSSSITFDQPLHDEQKEHVTDH